MEYPPSLKSLLDTISSQNSIISWSIYPETLDTISVKIKFTQKPVDQNRVLHYKRKPQSQVRRDRLRTAAWRVSRGETGSQSGTVADPSDQTPGADAASTHVIPQPPAGPVLTPPLFIRSPMPDASPLVMIAPSTSPESRPGHPAAPAESRHGHQPTAAPAESRPGHPAIPAQSRGSATSRMSPPGSLGSTTSSLPPPRSRGPTTCSLPPPRPPPNRFPPRTVCHALHPPSGAPATGAVAGVLGEGRGAGLLPLQKL